MTEPRRYFIAGATGYTGRALVDRAIEAGTAVVAHIRPSSSKRAEEEARVVGLGGEVDCAPWDPESLAESLGQHQPDVVFALLGTTKKRMRREQSGVGPSGYEAIDYGLTSMLLSACRTACPSARFVYLSSQGVTDGAKNPYLAVRARMEAELKASGQPFVILQPSFITGPDREDSRPLERVGAVLADGVLGGISVLGGKKLRDRYSSVDAQTLADWLRQAGDDSDYLGKTVGPDDFRRTS